MVSRHLTMIALVICALALAGCNSAARDFAPIPSVGTAPSAPATETPVAAANHSGAQLYQQHCSGCHGRQGQGVPNAGVGLADEAGEEAAELRDTILKGKGKMPGFRGRVTDAQVSAMIEHVRTFASSKQEKHDDDKSERHR